MRRANATPADPNVFSYHAHRDRCTGATRRVPIEPLREALFADYTRHGVEFDRVVGWEKAPQDHGAFMSRLPRELTPRLSFFNVPADPRPGAADN
eukprot:gene13382-66727_t